MEPALPGHRVRPLEVRRSRYGVGHQKGNFMPGGRGMPAVNLLIFSAEVASAGARRR